MEVSKYISVQDREYELIWDVDPNGIYSPKANYTFLSAKMQEREPVWWWKKLLKLKCPPKTKLFMWNVFENKVPTWDNLQKRNKQGLGWCPLCGVENDSVDHLFLRCNFGSEVWEECKRLT